MKRLKAIVQRISGWKSNRKEEFPIPVDVPSNFSFYDLCDYVGSLYNVFETSYQKYLETREDEYALRAIDALVTINQLERMKTQLEVQIYHS